MSFYDGEYRIVRWDKVVHIIKTGLPELFSADGAGRMQSSEAISVTMVCGRRAKLYYGGKNRFTTEAPTCLACVVGGYVQT